MFTVTFNNTFIHFFCLSFQLFQKILKLHTSFFFFLQCYTHSYFRHASLSVLHGAALTLRQSDGCGGVDGHR